MQSKDKILELIRVNKGKSEKLQAICDYLNQVNEHYDWVGFYFKNGSKNELKLGPYSGEETDHKIIPFGKGICGQVAVSNETLIVSDVSAESNYISCGWKVKSEIVIPVFVAGENIGQIDIDSHTLNAFSEKDEEILNFICQEVAKFDDVLDLVNI
jgi:GAF domain-containing protein